MVAEAHTWPHRSRGTMPIRTIRILVTTQAAIHTEDKGQVVQDEGRSTLQSNHRTTVLWLLCLPGFIKATKQAVTQIEDDDLAS